MIRRPPRSTLFPYTTLFRSQLTPEWLSRPPRAFRDRTEDGLQDRISNLPGELAGVSQSLGSDLDLIGHVRDRKSTRLNSSHLVISYAVFCLKKKKHQSADDR